jgi:MiaB-like tRNA modifying enzyme
MRVFVKGFGCSSSLADSEVLAGCLAEAGYEVVDGEDAADVLIYNTCAVKGPTENRLIDLLTKVPVHKKVIVAGCLPLINFERLCRETRFDGVIGPAGGDKIVDVVARVLKGEKVVALDGAERAKPSLLLPRLQSNPVVSIIPINYGCLGSCTYCCVVHARGHLRSHSVQEIVTRARTDLCEGIREFWLTSQDTGCFGRNSGSSLAELLDSLCGVEGDFKIRVGMMTPNTVMDILEDLIQAFRNDKVFKFVHLPLQSGDEDVLRGMRRFYLPSEFRSIVESFRKVFPDITIATDIICGFPGESEEAFGKTLKLIGDVKPDIVNVSKFFARPGTEAAKMQDRFVPFSEIKRRSSAAASLARRMVFERNRGWVGWNGSVLIDEIGKVPNSFVGRNFAYKPIVVKSAKAEMFGRVLNVKVIRVLETYLEGEIVNGGKEVGSCLNAQNVKRR